MSFLVVLCEGYTEMDFVQQVLALHLAERGIHCRPALFGKKLKHDRAEAPGGIFKYQPVFRHINAALRQYSSPSSFVTTMMDFYAFPQDFPDYDALAKEADAAKRVRLFEEAMFNQVGRNDRFIPHIQLHEFETLVFSQLEAVEYEFSDDARALQRIGLLRDQVSHLSAEEINQTPEGAPSKRLLAALPSYRKRDMGIRITRTIGWKHLKETCPHFGAWLTQLERLGN